MYFFYYSYNFKKNRDLNMIFRKYFVASFKIYRYIYIPWQFPKLKPILLIR